MLSIKGGSPCRCKGRSKAGGCKCKKSQTSRKQSRRSASRRKSPKRKSPRRARSSSKPRGRVAQTVANAVANEIQKVAAAESASPGQLPAAAQKAMPTAASDAVKDAAVAAATAFPTPSAPPADLPAVSQQAAQQAAAASVGDAIREAVGAQPTGIDVAGAAANVANAASNVATTAVATAANVSGAVVSTGTNAATSIVPVTKSPTRRTLATGILSGLALAGIGGVPNRSYFENSPSTAEGLFLQPYRNQTLTIPRNVSLSSSGLQPLFPATTARSLQPIPEFQLVNVQPQVQRNFQALRNWYNSASPAVKQAFLNVFEQAQNVRANVGRRVAEFFTPTENVQWLGPREDEVNSNVTSQ